MGIYGEGEGDFSVGGWCVVDPFVESCDVIGVDVLVAEGMHLYILLLYILFDWFGGCRHGWRLFFVDY
jgi:hypothetical protein